MRIFTIGLIFALFAFSTGIYAASEIGAVGSAYKHTRYVIRTTLGLEKSWVDISTRVSRPLDQPVNCPSPAESLVVVTGGQSNAANAISSYFASDPADRVYAWYDGACHVARDPLPGATGADGSLWTNLGVELGRAVDRPVVLINGAISATQYADWLDSRSLYLQTLLDNVAQAQAYGFEPRLVLWHQGETDAGTKFDTNVLQQQITELTSNLLLAMPESELYLFRTSKCTGDGRENGVPEVREVQTRVAEGNDRMIVGMNTDELGNDYRWDKCHFNSLGRAAIIETIVPELAAYLSPDTAPTAEN
ncbi:MAG: hypothetical protein DI533_11645 [Cereibacter sphaeroides]|uniref:Sialate O-acetylesterase domain-containing protein n=1 Tax=Cereibacter sphaeroides TaxID=1063 RepID=A0A2W5S7A8_CERSP|nr:MAG: hypothetical protein DI533_11645 [Cereibacter sphaeroides]